jgi:hypothetical protein
MAARRSRAWKAADSATASQLHWRLVPGYDRRMTHTAKRALISTGTNRQGAVPTDASPADLAELERLGYIGPGGGLTRRGTIARERAVTADLDDLFG